MMLPRSVFHFLIEVPVRHADTAVSVRHKKRAGQMRDRSEIIILRWRLIVEPVSGIAEHHFI